MTEIPDRPFNKIVMDLVTDFTESNKGNKHILTIIDLLTGWPEAILIPNKSADTITKAFIRHYLPRHLCPWFILSDNGMEFKNQIFDKVTKDLGIERICSASYHPQSNGKLETFQKFLKPTLKKICAEDQDNWDDYVEQVLGTYRGVLNLTTGESPFFLRVYFKNKTPGKWDLKWRAGYRIVWIECEGRYLHIENQATGKIRSCNVKDVVLEPIRELWNVNPEFGTASKFINHLNNLPDFTPDTQ